MSLQFINLAANTFEMGQVFLVTFSILCGTWLLACFAASVAYMGSVLLWSLTRSFHHKFVLSTYSYPHQNGA